MCVSAAPAHPRCLSAWSSPRTASSGSGHPSATPLLLTALSLMLQEGEDKAFLIQKLHSVCRYKHRRS